MNFGQPMVQMVQIRVKAMLRPALISLALAAMLPAQTGREVVSALHPGGQSRRSTARNKRAAPSGR